MNKNIRLRYREEMLDGEIPPLLLKLGIPGALGLFLQNAFNLIDRLFVARLGEEELGAVGIAFIIQTFILALGGGLSSGLRSHSSRSAGADDRTRIRDGAHQGLAIILLAGFALPLAGVRLIPFVYGFMGLGEGLLEPAEAYTNIILWGALFQLFVLYGNSLLRGIGEMKIPFRLLVLSLGVNMILDPLLIFGWGPVPALGVEGAALATVMSRGAGAIATFVILIKENIIKPSDFLKTKPDLEIFKSIMGVGFPAMFNRSLGSLSLGFVYGMIAPFGAGAAAAYTACFTLRRLVLIPTHGFSGGAVTMMGVNNGARRFGRTRQIFFSNARLTTLVLVPLIIALMLLARPLLSLLLSEKESLDEGVAMLRILAPGYLFIALRTGASGGLNSLGKGFAAMAVTLAHNFFFTLPAAWMLSRIWGTTGLCLGLTGGYALSAAAGAGIFLGKLKKESPPEERSPEKSAL